MRVEQPGRGEGGGEAHVYERLQGESFQRYETESHLMKKATSRANIWRPLGYQESITEVYASSTA